MLDEGKVVRLGRIGMTRDHLEAFARTLTHDDHVVVEATGNASAVAEVIAPHVGRVVIANPREVRMNWLPAPSATGIRPGRSSLPATTTTTCRHGTTRCQTSD